MDGRRRQFPRYYFVSEADLLDILSNGSDPNKILVHTPKVRAGVRERQGEAMLLQSAGFKNVMACCLSPSSSRFARACCMHHTVKFLTVSVILSQVYLCCKTLVLGDELMPSGRCVHGFVVVFFKWSCYRNVLVQTRSLGLPIAAGGRTLHWVDA